MRASGWFFHISCPWWTLCVQFTSSQIHEGSLGWILWLERLSLVCDLGEVLDHELSMITFISLLYRTSFFLFASDPGHIQSNLSCNAAVALVHSVISRPLNPSRTAKVQKTSVPIHPQLYCKSSGQPCKILPFSHLYARNAWLAFGETDLFRDSFVVQLWVSLVADRSTLLSYMESNRFFASTHYFELYFTLDLHLGIICL